MESITTHQKPVQHRLRAVVEIVGDKWAVYPVASSEQEAAEIFDALKLIREDFSE